MRPCPADDDLADLVRGAHGLADDARLEAHLADCPACSGLLATLLAEGDGDDDDDAVGGAPAVDGRDAAARPATRAGRTLGPYRLDGKIGAGAMGEVWAGHDLRLARPVAIKVLPAALAASPARIRRLEAEARAAAAIAHPNVVRIYDVGRDDDVAYVVSELIDGESLRSLLDRRAVSATRARTLGVELARGLAAAHDRGVIHRDLKPENLIVTADGHLKILDFGLAKVAGDRGDAVDHTEPGAVLGTAGYLSPEQARGEPADARSDLFAVGAILYELATGDRAFGGATFAERLSAVLRDRPVHLDDDALGDLAPLVARCLDKDPRRRFQSAGDLAFALDAAPAARAASADAGPPATAAATVSRRAFLAGTAATGLGALAAGTAVGRWLSRRPAGGRAEPGFRVLTYRHGRVVDARLTPDGGSVVYGAAWNGAPCAVFTTRIGGGGTRPLALPPADLLAVSSQGTLALALDRRYVEGASARGRLAVVPIEGGEPRVVADDIQDADFGPDGALCVVRPAGAGGFVLEAPPGTARHRAGWITHPRVSPDGRFIACLVHPSPYDDRGDVVVVDRAGAAAPRVLSSGWTSLAGLAWARDGRALWFGGSRRGADNAIHEVTLGGREREIAASAGRLRLHDRGDGGRAIVSHDTWRLRTIVRAPGGDEVDLSTSDFTALGGLSADGATIALGDVGDAEPIAGCYLRATRGDRLLRLGDGMPLALSPDGERVVAQRLDEPSRLTIYAAREPGARRLALGPITDVAWARWRGDDVIVGGAAADRAPRLWLLAGDRPPTPLTDEDVHGTGAVSGDGARVAFVDRAGVLRIVATTPGGAAVEVPGRFAGQVACTWTTGDDALLVRGVSPPIAVARVDLATGAATPYATLTPPPVGRKGVDAVAITPDGRGHAYSWGEELSRLYAMTG
ncbi:MAG: serine/threonine protein kinase [Kofleriaceae bacterium]|nr:serine/threonine protein kinase [Kofleriaceae bacterium]